MFRSANVVAERLILGIVEVRPSKFVRREESGHKPRREHAYVDSM